MLKRFAGMVLALIWGGAALAEVSYPAPDLNRVLLKAGPNLRAVLYEDIANKLPPLWRDQLADIRLVFPEVGPNPIAFYAYPHSNEIHMPLTSIRFFDDIATLYAWFQSRNCRVEYIQTYVYSILRDDVDLPPPLEAFGLDRRILHADTFTYEASGKVYSSGLQFILAHELGHLLLQHRTGLTPQESQVQEWEADAFAFEHFARLGGSPAGIFWYFMTAWWFDPENEAGRLGASHPVTFERIGTMAELFQTRSMDFAFGEADPETEARLIREMGGMLSFFAEAMADPALRDFTIETVLRDFPLTRLTQACPH